MRLSHEMQKDIEVGWPLKLKLASDICNGTFLSHPERELAHFYRYASDAHLLASDLPFGFEESQHPNHEHQPSGSCLCEGMRDSAL